VVWLAVGLGVGLLGLVLYWLLVWTEGVYLGRRVVVWLYDLTARRYDRIKQFDAAHDRLAIARPVLAGVGGVAEPRVLDVATGTGRAVLALLNEPGFRGRTVGLDASRPMLARAAAKLAGLDRRLRERALLLEGLAAPLPFGADQFDAVVCLESLEFFPSDAAALAEMARVLRPGGLLLVSRRSGREGRLFLRRYRPAAAFEALLHDAGIVELRFFRWQVGYELVTGWKAIAPEREDRPPADRRRDGFAARRH
jgi:ubiquinone/menaquinone biosynthesis C-methylase UbiE